VFQVSFNLVAPSSLDAGAQAQAYNQVPALRRTREQATHGQSRAISKLISTSPKKRRVNHFFVIGFNPDAKKSVQSCPKYILELGWKFRNKKLLSYFAKFSQIFADEYREKIVQNFAKPVNLVA
jgi:hypothetical protein